MIEETDIKIEQNASNLLILHHLVLSFSFVFLRDESALLHELLFRSSALTLCFHGLFLRFLGSAHSSILTLFFDGLLPFLGPPTASTASTASSPSGLASARSLRFGGTRLFGFGGSLLGFSGFGFRSSGSFCGLLLGRDRLIGGGFGGSTLVVVVVGALLVGFTLRAADAAVEEFGEVLAVERGDERVSVFLD